MGFFRKQEERLAERLLEWQYQRQNIPLPEKRVLSRMASGLVDQAHKIATERGKNVLSIIRELVSDIKKNM